MPVVVKWRGGTHSAVYRRVVRSQKGLQGALYGEGQKIAGKANVELEGRRARRPRMRTPGDMPTRVFAEKGRVDTHVVMEKQMPRWKLGARGGASNPAVLIENETGALHRAAGVHHET